MHPVLKRILLHGGGTAIALAAVGFLFAEMAGMLAGGASKPASAELNPPVSDSLRYRVPLMMAFWGFVFVAVSELVLSRFRRPAPPKAEMPPDEAETLLNELLAQAEAKMALEAESQRVESQKVEGQEAEKKPEEGQKPPQS
jgi:hypothetical protein